MDADLPLELDLDLGPLEGFDDWDPPNEPVDIDVPPPPSEPEPWRGGEPSWADEETPGLTWAIVGSVAILGLLKVGFFMGGSMLTTLISAVLFVALHGLFIMVGASWFWPRRYR